MGILQKIKSHSVTKNVSALGVMQIANYIVPLLLLPFLARQLGIEAFGIVAITLAAIQLAMVLTDYGFSLSATYAISVKRNDPVYINKKIGAIFGAKAVLVGLAVIGFLVTPIFVPKFSAYTPFFNAAIVATVAQAFQPVWLFQGIERMKNITIYTVAVKVIYAALVLRLINTADDALLVIYCWSIAQVFGLVAAIYFMRAEGYRVVRPSLDNIKNEFKDGAQFFWSRIAVSLYTSASILVVGAYGAAQAAQFSVCEQIYKAGQNVSAPINAAMFPFMSKHKNWKVFFGVLAVSGILLIFGCAIVSIYAESILVLLFGEEYRAATLVLRIFLITTVVNYFAVSFGYSAFAALGRISIANISVMAGAALHMMVLASQYYFFEVNAWSVAVAVLITETFVMLLRVIMFLSIKRKSVVAM